MPRPFIVFTFLREIFSQRTLQREPEPNLVMEDSEEVAAYSEAGRIEGAFDAVYLFHSAHVSQVLQGCSTVLDLGCGPGTQLAHIAELNPQISFVGVDLSETMLQSGREHLTKWGIDNVRLQKGDITHLIDIADHSMDGVISTVAFHQLPDRKHLEACFKEIARVLKPGGAAYLVDFGRLKSIHSVIAMAYQAAETKPYLFTLDYERSLRAAFTYEDFIDLKRRFLPEHLKCVTTFKIPLFIIIKSEDHPLPDSVHELLQKRRAALPSRFQADLDDLRFFFRMGGLENDPFRGLLGSPGQNARQRMADFWDRPRLSRFGISTGSRVFRLGRAIAQIAMAYGRDRWDKTWVSLRMLDTTRTKTHKEALQKDLLERTGHILRDTLGSLKGPLMKIGQVASYMGNKLPPAIREALVPLQEASRPLPAERIRRIVERELGKPMDRLFSEWFDQPLAAASISQLHLARLPSGQLVVVKVKYPGIENAVRFDLRLLKMISPLLSRTMNLGNMRDLLNELSRMFLAECDFLDEARSQETFRRVCSQDSQILIPRIYSGYTTRNVLTMDYVDAMKFSEFVGTATPAQKLNAATIIGRMTATMIFRHRMLNADPHPGNYLFTPEGRVCLLDFGFVKRWPKETTQTIKTFGLAVYRQDVAEFTKAAKSLGYIKRGSELDYAAFLNTLRSSLFKPWMEDRPFSFRPTFIQAGLENIFQFLQSNGPICMAPDLLTFTRVFWGHQMIFSLMEVDMNWHRILYPLLQENENLPE